MQESLAFTRLLNHLFGPVVAGFLQSIGIHPAHPAAPINDVFSLELFVIGGLIVYFLAVRMTLSVESPGPAQHVAEMIHEFVGGQAESVIGHGYEKFQAFFTCVLLFILLNNLFGLLVGFHGVNTPTGEPAVPLGVAVLTFLYYNYQGVRTHGPGYIKQFLGPFPKVIPLTLLMLVVEVVSHLARMMSLTIRLYANMVASDLLTLICFSLVPFAAPVIFLGLHFFVAIIQAYVFMLLSMIYVAMAVAKEH